MSYLIRTTRELYQRLPRRIAEKGGAKVDYTLYDAEIWMKENLTRGMASRVIDMIMKGDVAGVIRMFESLGMGIPPQT